MKSVIQKIRWRQKGEIKEINRFTGKCEFVFGQGNKATRPVSIEFLEEHELIKNDVLDLTIIPVVVVSGKRAKTFNPELHLRKGFNGAVFFLPWSRRTGFFDGKIVFYSLENLLSKRKS